MTAQPAYPVERRLNHPASSSLFIRMISLKSALPIPPPYLKPCRVSAHRSSRSFTSPHHCAYSLIIEWVASILSSLGLIWLDTLSTCMNISNGKTSAPLHNPHLSSSSTSLLPEKNKKSVVRMIMLFFSSPFQAELSKQFVKSTPLHILGSFNDGWLSLD